MNGSFQEGGNFQMIIEWFRSHDSPSCKATNSLASLRSGVAIAEVLAKKLPSCFHGLFLPKIEIYHLNPQRSMTNLKVLLATLKTFFSQYPQEQGPALEQFSAEGLYFDHNMMETFLLCIIVPLKGVQNQENYENVLRESHEGENEISDIANLSSIIAHREPRVVTTDKDWIKIESKQLERKDSVELDEEELKIQKLCEWLEQQHRIVVEQCEPQEILGELVNSVFAGSRLDKQKIVKKTHYELGSSIVLKKVGDFLLNCQRMPKQNVLAMLEEIQQGCMREQLFWNVVEDIMNIKSSHLSKMRKNSSKKTVKVKTNQDLAPANKENLENMIPKELKTKKQKKQDFEYHCSAQTVQMAQKWIQNELGYEFSLGKSKKQGKIQENPLLNGVLLGSIVMRMQLGKVTTNKQPKNKLQVRKNMSEVMTCIIRRGIEAGRKFAKVKPTYCNFLGVIWQVKQEIQKKKQLQKTRNAQIDKAKIDSMRIVTQEEKKMIEKWLTSRGIEVEREISVSIVSKVCGEILELRLLRQTTKRIQQSNISKILEQMYRLGWQGQGGVSQTKSPEGVQVRWDMLKFAFELMRNKVYYCR